MTDYSKIVTSKIDLETVRSKQKNTRYGHVEAFFAELLLVYVNAVSYFEQGGTHRNKVVYEAAKVRFCGVLCCVGVTK